MNTNVVKLLTVPAESIFGNGVKGTLRVLLEDNGECTVQNLTPLDDLTAFKVLAAFDRLAQVDGWSVMGCAFISTKK
jgi:hypothetical protein